MLAQGFARANGTDKTMYDTFSQRSDRAKQFGNAMASFVKGTGYDLKHLVNNFPWYVLGNGTVVDVSYIHDNKICQSINPLI